MDVQGTLWWAEFESIGYLFRCNTIGSLGRSICLFFVLEILNLILLRLQKFTFPTAVYMGTSFSASSPVFAVVCFLVVMPIMIRMRQNLGVILVYIFLMAKDGNMFSDAS